MRRKRCRNDERRLLSGVVAIQSIGTVLLLSGISTQIHSQTISPVTAFQTPASEEQRRRSQAEAWERQQQLQAPRVNLESDAAEEKKETFTASTLPTESPCFTIQLLVLQVPSQLPPALQLAGASALPLDPFHFAQDYVQQYAGRCIGSQGVNIIVRGLTGLILQRGYSTVRVGVPEQDLSSGTLTLSLVPGVIRSIRFADASLYGTPRNAFPTGGGRLLTLRDLEQGLEQMKRVPSQDVDMQIIPSDAPGESDIILNVTRRKPWKLVATFDDSGAKGTGKLQLGGRLSMDNPLGLSDMFNIGMNTDADRRGKQRGTEGRNVYYAIPFGYWNYSVAASQYTYHQKIAGNNQDFISSGKSKNIELTVSQLFQRSQTQKNRWQFRVGKRWNNAYIDDTEIQVQKRNTTFFELGWIHTHYFGAAQLDMTFANRWGSALLGAKDNPPGRTPDYPTYMYSLQSLDATFVMPFQVVGKSVTYLSTLRAQHTRSPLYLTDQFTIGGRYTVRGFDGELTLAGESGFYLRNELNFPIFDAAQSVYAGIDIGKVYGSNVQYLVGDKLVGTTLGLRGAYKGLRYDMFSSWALHKPEQFATAAPAVGFSLTYQY